MAADLHIHIYQGLEELDLADFFSNTIGSKYFHPKTVGQSLEGSDISYQKVCDTPNIWIGNR